LPRSTGHRSDRGHGRLTDRDGVEVGFECPTWWTLDASHLYGVGVAPGVVPMEPRVEHDTYGGSYVRRGHARFWPGRDHDLSARHHTARWDALCGRGRAGRSGAAHRWHGRRAARRKESRCRWSREGAEQTLEEGTICSGHVSTLARRCRRPPLSSDFRGTRSTADCSVPYAWCGAPITGTVTLVPKLSAVRR